MPQCRSAWDDLFTPMSRPIPLVLVVDDDAFVRRVLRDSLADARIATVDAVDGVDALDQLRVGLRPAVILLDMIMPRLGGVGFLTQMRADPILANIPVVAMSACPTWSENVKVRARVQKPIDFDYLLPLIETICAGRAGA
jgi:CheY-like chemotaxis protein